MKRTLSLFLLMVVTLSAFCQKDKLPKLSAGFPINYEEDSVGTYALPDLFSNKRETAKTWNEKRRPQLLKLFEEIEYGKMPGRPPELHFNVFEKGTPVLNGKAIRKQVSVYFTKDTSDHKMNLLIYLPAKTTKPSPLILCISFVSNNQAVDDTAVPIGYIWTREGQKIKADQPSRFTKMNVEQFIDAGFGYATVYYGEIEPDFKGGIKYGIRSQYLKPGETQPAADEWGAISAWAWGLSRAMDYFETDKEIDSKRIALQGASRLGKTALWTGVHDQRFAVVIASISGEGGAALSRRDYGENLKHITDTSRYYYQFAPNYHSYAARVNELPFDAHTLVALMAPRPLLLQTGDSDYWSDPKGEFLSAVAAEPVYNLFGKKGPGTKIFPEPGDESLLMKELGYYMHKGGHTVLPEDWTLFIKYLKKFL